MHQRLSWVAAVVLALGACGDSTDDADACLPMLPRDCAPDPEPPTFPALYMDIFRSCGAPGTGTSCHGAGNNNGLELTDMETAYDELLGHGEDGRARVIEGNPECSVLVHRLESDNPEFRMPKGNNKLSAGRLCAVRQWIANGAERDED